MRIVLCSEKKAEDKQKNQEKIVLTATNGVCDFLGFGGDISKNVDIFFFQIPYLKSEISLTFHSLILTLSMLS